MPSEVINIAVARKLRSRNRRSLGKALLAIWLMICGVVLFAWIGGRLMTAQQTQPSISTPVIEETPATVTFERGQA